MTPDSMRFKAAFRNQSAKTGIPAQLLLQDFFIERFLSRVCVSDVRTHFVFKGGVLLMGLLGLSRRTTMDLDATLCGAELSKDNVIALLRRICGLDTGDNVLFSIISASAIRENDQYGGFRVKIAARFETVSGQVSIDVSTGDALPGGPVEHHFPSQFEPDRQFRILGYPVESILAEKVEAVFALGELGTRPRDYYDIYMIANYVSFSHRRFCEAFRATTLHRNSLIDIGTISVRVAELAKSVPLNAQWEKYRKRFPYAANLSFRDAISALVNVVSLL